MSLKRVSLKKIALPHTRQEVITLLLSGNLIYGKSRNRRRVVEVRPPPVGTKDGLGSLQGPQVPFHRKILSGLRIS